MRSQDILPTRLDAAKAAAKDFVAAPPNRVRLGLVMFGGYPLLLGPPGTDRPLILEAIDGLGFVRRTAIGEGLLEAVVALPERFRPGLDGPLPAPSGPRPPGIVILLSDGRSNTGIDPLEAAEIARRQEVTVYTIGVGQPFTPDNVYTLGGSLDEYTLKEIARLTGGTYHHASSAEALRGVYQKLARTVGWERRPPEAGAARPAPGGRGGNHADSRYGCHVDRPAGAGGAESGALPTTAVGRDPELRVPPGHTASHHPQRGDAAGGPLGEQRIRGPPRHRRPRGVQPEAPSPRGHILLCVPRRGHDRLPLRDPSYDEGTGRHRGRELKGLRRRRVLGPAAPPVFAPQDHVRHNRRKRLRPSRTRRLSMAVRATEIVWQPTREHIEQSRLVVFMRQHGIPRP